MFQVIFIAAICMAGLLMLVAEIRYRMALSCPTRPVSAPPFMWALVALMVVMLVATAAQIWGMLA